MWNFWTRTIAGGALAAMLVLGAAYAPSIVKAQAQTVVLHRGNGAEPDSLDPHKSSGTWENHIIGDMLIGIFTEDIDGKPIHGAAESHSVSEDGLTWTFKIRPHNWSDGVPVTADDFVFSWRRILDPATASQYATLLYPFKNAQAVNEGKLPPDQLGVRAIDASTLELQLENPAPYLPQLLAHQTAFPVPKHLVEHYGADWFKPGIYVSNGPYVLAAWEPNNFIKLIKNPGFWDAANVQIDEVIFYPTDNTSAALKRLRAGELDMQNGVSSQDIDWLKANMPEALKLQPYLAVSYIAINSTRAPLNDKRVREALSLAFDRDTVADKVLKFNEAAAYTFVPPGTAGIAPGAALSFASMPYAERLAKAQALMQEAGFGPGKPLKIALEIGPAPDNKRVGAVVQQQWAAIYVDLELRASESKVLYALLKENNFDVSQAAWVADYNDAKNFLYLFRTESKDMNYGRWSNAEFDRLMAEADKARDEAARGALLRQAEQVLLDDYAVITNRYLNTRHIVQPYVKGFHPNLRDVNRTRWLSIERAS